MSGSQPLSVESIDHLTIVVKDLDTSADFYGGILGMRSVERPDFGFPGRWFQAGRTMIHLNQTSAEAGGAGLPRFVGTRDSHGFHYAFMVNDCDAAAEQLLQQGMQIVEGPRSRPDGARQLYIRDPDGHLVELTSVPK